jgi:prepilin-type N-terminal cleavage/methylation domain-containing protein
MHMSPLRRHPSARSESGFTLVELVVGMAIGLIVSFAAFAIIETTMRSQARIADRAEVTQKGRTAMEELIQELHSGCIVVGLSPVRASDNGINSDKWSMVFVTGLGAANPPTVSEHILTLSGGSLLDTTYAQLPNLPLTDWRFQATSLSQRTLVSNIAAAYSPAGGTPIFTYYAYQNPPAGLSTLTGSTAMTTPLSSTDAVANSASAVAKVAISFQAIPASGSLAADRSQTFSDSAVLRLAPAAEGTGGVSVPCA